MLPFNPREYSVRELFDSHKRGETILSPKFQRRSVWEYKAKSYLIDSIIRGYPVPRIFIRENTDYTLRTTREIIDGQQRLKTIFDFIQDGFEISKIHNSELGGLQYSQLPENIQKLILNYPISAILLIDLSDDEVFNIFARLNTYAVKLNSQELLNSQYFGVYKQMIYRVASEYRDFWVDSKILSIKGVARMGDAELISDIVSVIVEGKIQNKTFETSKKTYEKYDDVFVDEKRIESTLKFIIDLIGKTYSDDFSETSFAQIPLFYSLVLVLYHLVSPIECFSFQPFPLRENDIPKLKTVLDQIDYTIKEFESLTIDEETIGFINSLKKNTTTPNVRMRRCEYLGKRISNYLSESHANT